MKKTVLMVALAFSLCAVDHSMAATITIDKVEALKPDNKPYHAFDLSINWDKVDQKWTDLNTERGTDGGKTFFTKGKFGLNKKGAPTALDNRFMEYNGKKPSDATWAYRMEISLYQTESGAWDWYGTIQRWEKQAGQNKNMFRLVEEVNKETHVPLPGAAWLLGAGLIGLVGIRRRFRKS